MPSPRRLLTAFALVAIVLGSAAGASAELRADADRPRPRPAAVIDEAEVHRPALRRIQRRATLGERAATIALRAVGVPYRWGGASPAGGFDCSGLVYWTYRRLGLELAHSSYALYDLGRRVPRSRLKPGDVLFFSGLGHVGVYVGRGRMVHAPQSGRRVEVVALGRSYYGRRLVGARRMLRT
jgi:murein DD-endopeptidase